MRINVRGYNSSVIMGDPGHDWDSSSDAASPSPLGSQNSVITSNGTKKHINRGRWTKEEVRLNLRFRIQRKCFSF